MEKISVYEYQADLCPFTT